jgi:hypothetical protein
MELWLIALILGALSLFVGLIWPNRPNHGPADRSQVRNDIGETMNDGEETVVQFVPPEGRKLKDGGLTVVDRTAPLSSTSWNSKLGDQPYPPTILGHLVNSVNTRIHLKIDAKTASASLPALRTLTDRTKLAAEYQASLNTLSLAEAEREVRQAELEQKKIELAAQRRQQQHLDPLRLQKDQLTLKLEVAQLQRSIQAAENLPGGQQFTATPEQQRRLKRMEIEDKLRELARLEADALKTARDDEDRARLQNMYGDKREELREQLAKFLV